jgi:hypothetical protein
VRKERAPSAVAPLSSGGPFVLPPITTNSISSFFFSEHIIHIKKISAIASEILCPSFHHGQFEKLH